MTGKPIQNASAESFNGRLRDECLNANWYRNLWGARREDHSLAQSACALLSLALYTCLGNSFRYGLLQRAYYVHEAIAESEHPPLQDDFKCWLLRNFAEASTYGRRQQEKNENKYAESGFDATGMNNQFVAS